MISKHALFFSASLVFLPGLVGCVFTNGGGPGDTNGTQNTTEQDIAQYESTQAALETHRSVFSNRAMEPAAVENRLFWLEFPGFDPSVHSFDATTGQKVDYTFPIGSGDKYNYRASETMVVTAELGGDKVVYHAYDITKPEQSLGELSLPAPGGGVRWYAYAPDKTDVYYITTDDGTALWKWTPGQAGSTRLFTLESTGAEIGEFWDFGVDGSSMVFIEGGRIWHLDIAAKKSTWLGNKTESMSAAWDKDGVLFSTAEGPFFYSFTNPTLLDVAAAIESSGFKLNNTYDSIHHYSQDLARHKNVVGYIGGSGFFTYDLATKTVKPILLNARDNSVTYRYPVILANGTMFVQGLESESGSIGADGPLFRVDP